MRVELRLMGFPQIRLNDRPVTFGLRKGLALLAYLVIEGRPLERDEIAGLLWPETDDSAARARLRRTLHELQLAADGAQLIEFEPGHNSHGRRPGSSY